MQAWTDAERRAGKRVALVPTMGALHDGHLTLVREARRHADRVVVSIFVNPMQFNRRDDFERDPRPIDDDLARCAEAGVDAVYAPNAAATYPEGFQSAVEVAKLTEPLCGASRPGHFRGVTTVVTKLFHAVRPDAAVFGEKDYQQLVLVRRMVADLCIQIDVVGGAIVREPDGLALSSRNAYLGAGERKAALALSRALAAGARAAAGGCDEVVAAARAVLDPADGVDTDYLELRAPDLGPAPVRGEARLLVAARVGTTRLIDNTAVVLGQPLDSVGR
jgi:pantoate--beta-alanine ligase